VSSGSFHVGNAHFLQTHFILDKAKDRHPSFLGLHFRD
jgi:hypothetical protein